MRAKDTSHCLAISFRQFACVIALLASSTCVAGTTPGWLHIASPRPLDEAREAYYDLATSDLAPQFDPSETLKLRGSTRGFWGGDSGPLAGQWTFYGKPGDQLPRSAQRVRISRQAPYRVDAWIYCDGPECSRLEGELLAMSPPRPHDAQNTAQWLEIKLKEPCDAAGPLHAQPPQFPREERRRGIEGTVLLAVFYNRCGDVLDAGLTKSSGNRNLDRAGMTAAMKWRVQPTTANKPGWQQATIAFLTDERGVLVNPPASQVPPPGAARPVGPIVQDHKR